MMPWKKASDLLLIGWSNMWCGSGNVIGWTLVAVVFRAVSLSNSFKALDNPQEAPEAIVKEALSRKGLHVYRKCRISPWVQPRKQRTIPLFGCLEINLSKYLPFVFSICASSSAVEAISMLFYLLVFPRAYNICVPSSDHEDSQELFERMEET